MPQRPGDGAGMRSHGTPRSSHPSRLVRVLPGLSRGGNYVLGIVLAALFGAAQLPPFNASDQGVVESFAGRYATGAAVTAATALAEETAAREANIRSNARQERPPRKPSLPPEQLTGYRWPLLYASITTWFAPTDAGFIVIDGKRVHDGIDLATSCGDTVRAAHAGVVLHAGREFDRYIGYSIPPEGFLKSLKSGSGLGILPIVVVVDDGNGYRSAYVHLSSTFVRTGQRIRAGQPIGIEGETGHATGCHLHYELIRMDGTFQAVAPELVRAAGYPPFVRERVDPLRVLSFLQRGAPRQLPYIPPPVPPIR
jgi:murein DD-endopeptidase MepM/ murein hydrolase activator NlpD